VAYVLLVERLERQYLVDRQVLLMRGGEPPPFDQQQQLLDESLEAEPQTVQDIDDEQWELRRALGVA
jgi:hypothetical protein